MLKNRDLDDLGESETFKGFHDLLQKSPEWNSVIKGSILKGVILAVEENYVVIDAGLKSESRVALREFCVDNQLPHLEVGNYVDVYVERIEGRDGLTVLSHEKAKREVIWLNLEKSFQSGKPVEGVLLGRIRGGFSVDLSGITAFLPSSHLDTRPVKNVSQLMGLQQSFSILKFDRDQENIVISRRAILEESLNLSRIKLLSSLEEGDIYEGVVKNITDYGAFIDLGGVDGLLHVTDMSWTRIDHPSSVLKENSSVRVQVLRYNKLTKRISLGMKQLTDDPWKKAQDALEVGLKIKGIVTNVAEYGVFVELYPGIEGLAHISEISWARRNVHLSENFLVGQQLEVMILDFDLPRRRISLGVRQCLQNPWEAFSSETAIGSILDGEVCNLTDFGLFIRISEVLDGMVHISDLSWTEEGEEAIKKYKPGDKVTVKVLDINPEKERISLGIKQLQIDPLNEFRSTISPGSIVTCEITRVLDDGLEVKAGGLPGFIRKLDLGSERTDQKTNRFAVGEKLDAKVLFFNKISRRAILSVRAREDQEKREVVKQYGSVDSGASLGDILSSAFEEKERKDQDKTKDPSLNTSEKPL